MKFDRFPVEVLSSMDTHIRCIKEGLHLWSDQELVETKTIWEYYSKPKEYIAVMTDEITRRKLRK